MALLNLLTMMQLNLLGKYYYEASVVEYVKKTAQEEITVKTTINDELESDFLSLSWWLLRGAGNDKLSSWIETCIENTLKE